MLILFVSNGLFSVPLQLYIFVPLSLSFLAISGHIDLVIGHASCTSPFWNAGEGMGFSCQVKSKCFSFIKPGQILSTARNCAALKSFVAQRSVCALCVCMVSEAPHSLFLSLCFTPPAFFSPEFPLFLFHHATQGEGLQLEYEMTLTNGQSFWTQHFSADEFGETWLKVGGIYFA